MPENNSFEEKKPLSDSEETASTVFSAPNEHNDKKPKNQNLWLKVLCIFLAVLLVAGGTFAVIKLIPEKNEDYIEAYGGTQIISRNTADFSEITVKNAGREDMVFKSSISEDDNSSEIVWTLEGIDNDLLDSTSVGMIATYASGVNVTNEYDVSKAEELAKYGLESPQCSVFVKCKTGSDYSFSIGNQTGDKSGYYLSVSFIPDKVYVAGSTLLSSFNVDALHFAKNEAMKAVKADEIASEFKEDDSVTTYSAITLSAGIFDTPFSFKPNENERFSSYANHIMVSPNLRIARNVEDLFSLFSSGVSTSSTVSFNKDPGTLKEFGLDNPDFTVTATFKNKSYSCYFKSANKDSGTYYVYTDCEKIVRLTNLSLAPFLQYKESDYYGQFMILEELKDVTAFNISGEIDATFTVNYDEDNSEYSVKKGNTDIKGSDFQSAYASLVGVTAVDYNTAYTESPTTLKIEIKHLSGKAPTVLEFKKISETRYQYYLSGSPMGQITSSNYSMIVKTFSKL